MIWSELDVWIVVAAGLAGLSCALLGSFLVLRKLSMMGDAISHAVLPGIAVAFWATQSRAPFAMVLGAVAAGLLTALLTQTLNRMGKVEEGASMGVVFTVMFAIGLVLLERVAHHVDLDLDCVLFGVLSLVPIADVFPLGPWFVPLPVLRLAVLLIVNLISVSLLYKEWKLSSFDEQLSTSLGIHAGFMHYLLMVLTSVTTVFCFEIVGSILVIAMLIVPAASARLLTDRFGLMLLYAMLLAVLYSIGGHVAAQTIPDLWGFSDTSTSGGIAVVSGLGFFLVLLFAPRHGILHRQLHQRALYLQTLEEDALGWLFRSAEKGNKTAPISEILVSRTSTGVKENEWRKVLRRLRSRGWVKIEQDDIQLSDEGRTAAAHLIRSHRLWETWLHEHTPLTIDHLHLPAEQLEHITDAALLEKLSHETREKDHDPMGRHIPD